MLRQFLLIFLLLFSNVTLASSEYKVLIGLPPGGAVDMNLQHLVSIAKTKDFKFDPVYKVGAAGAIAMKEFLEPTNSKTLLFGGTGTIISQNVVFKKVPEYSVSNYRPVLLTAKSPLLLVVPAASSKIQNFDELFRPGCNKRVTVSTGGFTHELFGRLLAKKSTCEIALLVYPNEPATMADTAAGVVDLAIVNRDTLITLGGRLIATTAAPSDARWNKVPTYSKYVQNSEFYLFFGLLAPAQMAETEYDKLISNTKLLWNNPAYHLAHPLTDGISDITYVYGKDAEKEIVRMTEMLRSISGSLDLQK